MAKQRVSFRFEDLKVWQLSADIAIDLGDIAERLKGSQRYRYAEQLRAASLSISNNIAEGSGSSSKKDFRHFLNMSHRSAFECANMLMIFHRQGFVTEDEIHLQLVRLDEVCRMITGLAKSLN